jgi:hypothetical protein
MAADLDHARIVEALTDTHQKRLNAIMRELEERVAALAMRAPLKEGELFDLVWSINARADLEQIMRETYLTEIDSQIREYQTIVDSLATMLNEYGDFTGVPADTITALQRVAFYGFQDIASTFSNELADELYHNALTGRPIEESIRNLRMKINGVYIQSDQDEIDRLVELAEAGDEDAVRELHQVYAADRTGRNMRRYARQMIVDSMMQFDAAVNVAAAREIGSENWKYYGTVVEDSRDFCVRHVNEIWDENEIRETWAATSWQGKADGDPFIVRGGYNCRHHFRPVFDEELENA